MKKAKDKLTVKQQAELKTQAVNTIHGQEQLAGEVTRVLASAYRETRENWHQMSDDQKALLTTSLKYAWDKQCQLMKNLQTIHKTIEANWLVPGWKSEVVCF